MFDLALVVVQWKLCRQSSSIKGSCADRVIFAASSIALPFPIWLFGCVHPGFAPEMESGKTASAPSPLGGEYKAEYKAVPLTGNREMAEDLERDPCPSCQRTFAPSVLVRHEKVCAKNKARAQARNTDKIANSS